MYINAKILVEVDVELRNDWEFGITGAQIFYSGRSLAIGQNFFILDAYIAKTIFKNRKGRFKSKNRTVKLWGSKLFNRVKG